MHRAYLIEKAAMPFNVLTQVPPIDTDLDHQGFLFLEMVSCVIGELPENLFNIIECDFVFRQQVAKLIDDPDQMLVLLIDI